GELQKLAGGVAEIEKIVREKAPEKLEEIKLEAEPVKIQAKRKIVVKSEKGEVEQAEAKTGFKPKSKKITSKE
ncbi:hypothetical protein MYX07_00700, partial [Patescibacteria group bacterium AH-259-L07]|nr:hypothetical protein [Patescibacteria group bacterium AH-259-L07]